MEYWNSLLTEKSWQILLELTEQTKEKNKEFDFIVIGGWAIYLWTKQHKSMDVDIALTNIKTLDYLKQHYNLKKNDRLKKYEISFEEIDVDIYVPYYSDLSIPIEDLNVHITNIENIKVPKPEILIILKQAAEINRHASVKGIKDQIDIMTLLLYVGIDFNKYFTLLKKYNHPEYYEHLKSLVKNFKEYNYVNLNPRQFKIKKEIILEKLKKTYYVLFYSS
ncbi:hypothetical protein HYY69_01290 [Candidatus Woesearchaeota archaeon]|nr:hypothetical protein [Candidatus Woesearchaeota archaeon]